MKIGIDCRLLGPEQGGLGRYVEQLVYQISLQDHANEYVLFLRRANFDAVKIGSEKFKYKKVLADIPWYSLKEQLVLPRILGKEKLDIVHFPHWNVPILYGCTIVVTIHDLIMYHYPRAAATTLGPIIYKIKDFFSRLILRVVVHRAKQILTTSEFTKQDLQKYFAVDEAKITMTYQAATLPPAEKPMQTAKPYVLYVGAAYPHKNLDRLVEAWPLIQKQTNHAYQLVLIGKKNYFYERLMHKIETLGLTDIVFTDFVQDSELPNWYAGASLFVFPSLYEGFGLPPLEAWAKGVPVAAARASCLPEILGNGAIYFDPESVDGMAAVIADALTNQALREQVREVAASEQKKYSWPRCAEQTLAVYKNAKNRG